MSDNRLKTPASISFNQIGGQRASDSQQAAAKGIPCQVVARNGQIVTVAFQMQVGGVGGPFTLVHADYPIGTSSGSDWYPHNKGTNGILLPSDFYLGGVSGQGGGTADYSQRGNLSTLAFFPIGNTAFQPPGGDTNKRCLSGPNGVYLQSDDGSVSLTVDKTNGITLKVGGKTWKFNSTGFTDSNNVVEETHKHTEVTMGTDETGPPTN